MGSYGRFTISAFPCAQIMTLVALCMLSAPTAAQNQLDLRPYCPLPSPQQFPFDKSYIVFDSVEQLRPETGTSTIIYCLKIDQAKRSYLINWPDLEWANVATRNDGYQFGRGPEIARATEVKTTEVYVGANQTRFTPTIRKEITKLEAIFKSFLPLVTQFFGSLPKSPDAADAERSGNFVPVYLRFRATYQDGSGVIAYVNEENENPKSVAFKFPDDIRAAIPELRDTLTVGPQSDVRRYKISGDPVPRRVRITFMNPDNQPVAAMPIVIYVSSPRR